MAVCFQALAGLTLQPNGWAGKTCFIANGMTLESVCFLIIGLTQFHTMTLPKQISLFTGEELTSSRVVFLANRTALPGNAEAKTTNATSGRKCLEQFGRFNHVGLWAKTFSELLIGTGDWYSTRCKLTWKLKGTKYKRMYFQLAPSTPRTAETGFGLLPTVAAMDANGIKNMRKDSNILQGGRHSVSLTHMFHLKMLPTPTSRDEKNGGKLEDGRIQRKIQQGYTVELNDLAMMGLLPTPTAASDAKGGCTRPDPKIQNDTLAHAMHAATGGQTGTTSQLNPQFVLEMMGFPSDWTELPFLSGETKASRQPETP